MTKEEKDPVKILQDFLDKEGLVLNATVEVVERTTSGGLITRPAISVSFKA